MTKISSLSDIGTGVASNDTFVLVDASDPTTPNKKIQQQNLFLIPDGSAGTPGLRFLNDLDTGIYSPGANQLALSTSGTGRLFIDSSGNVGIGTSSPAVLLNISSSANGTPATSGTTQTHGSFRIGSSATSGCIDFGPNGQNPWIQATDRTDLSQNYNLLLNPNGGRVGIGTTSPSYALDVSTTGSTISSSFTSDQSEQYIALKDSGTTLGHVRLGSTFGSMLFFAGNGDRGRFDSSGRLLVGTSSDSGGALLQVNDNRIRVATAKTPASASDTGTTGEICWDASYVYVCTATNTWKRAALSTW